MPILGISVTISGNSSEATALALPTEEWISAVLRVVHWTALATTVLASYIQHHSRRRESAFYDSLMRSIKGDAASKMTVISDYMQASTDSDCRQFDAW
jgi:hypothetical protein